MVSLAIVSSCIRYSFVHPVQSNTIMDELPPQEVHYLRDATAPSYPEPFYEHYQEGVPIAIDFGSCNVRAGLTNSSEPCNVFPTQVAKHRERKSNSTLTLVGNDIFREAPYYPTLRGGAKLPFDGLMVTNWDYVESILDYTLEHLGVQLQNGCLNNPVVLTEPTAALFGYRKGMYEIMFEAYRAPKVALGIDALFSYYYNSPKRDGIVVSVGNELTHVIPVLDGRGVLLNCKRIDWGGALELQFLQKTLALKYPYFPTRLTGSHTTNIVHDHCYVLKNYAEELRTYLDMANLDKNDVVIQAPVEIAPEKAKKSDEELARQAERRREMGRRLQEQAQKKRLESIIQKEREHVYYTQLRDELAKVSKTEAERRAVAEDFDGVADLHKYIESLERSLKRARTQDVLEPEEEVDPATSWPLAEVPDADLSEEQVKEKRKQKLMKANYEARMRIQEEKRKEEEEARQRQKEQQEWRERDLDDWCTSKRLELAQCIAEYKKRAKLLESMKDRKSMAAQQRMKNIAELANDQANSAAAKKRRRAAGASATIDNDPTDTFGANDADWNAYRDISSEALEEEQEVTNEQILALELELLEHDPNFHREDTFAASETFDWKNLVLHKFIHGPRQRLTLAMQAEGHDPDELLDHPEIIRRNHQLHINVERIRVPEIYFQPHITGLDQAGIPEVVQNLLMRNSDRNFAVGGQLRAMVENILVTGGGSLLPNFVERLRTEITAFLPTGIPLNVYGAKNPILDPWRGMQKWLLSPESQAAYVTRQEYEEMGPEYLKEHALGNVSLREY